MKQENQKYFLGLDLGTDSVGWAVSDTEYNLKKFNGKTMWGVRLFESGNSAAERRLHRTARRRNDRAVHRIDLLQEILKDEIAKIDPCFFIRLNDSKYHLEDKSEKQTNTLFNDINFKDKDYHKKYPTIYHLRKAIIDGEKINDIRLIYLAIVHIIKNRGHFLFDNEPGEDNFLQLFDEFNTYFDTPLKDAEKLKEILKQKGKKYKQEKLIEYGINNPIAELLIGKKVNASKYDTTIEKEQEIYIDFSGDKYEENYDKLSQILGDKINFINSIKKLYDWSVFADILNDYAYISHAKVAVYEQHKSDLKLLKKVIKEHCPEKYKEIFSETKKSNNYVAYIGNSMASDNKSKCEPEDFYKYIKTIIEKIDNDDGAEIKEKLVNQNFLPKQKTKVNSKIPYQINLFELKKILENTHLSCDIKEKIIKLMSFRIPYYVGPLNNKSDKAWLTRKAGEIYPWNFEEMVNIEESAECFIKRMTNKCEYLIGADVIPKKSLLYSKFMVLNELNNLKINGEKPKIEIKQKIFEELFKTKVKVTQKNIRSFINDNSAIISGIDGDFKSSYSSYIDMKNILGDNFDEKIAEEIIKAVTLFKEDKKILKKRLKKICSFTEEQIKKIEKLRYSDWGRLSRELLTEIQTTNKETGEVFTIIDLLYNTNDNFMEILYKYDFIKQIDEKNDNKTQNKFTYENIVSQLYVSPAIKRSIWQTLQITNEIKGIMKNDPEKIFIEVAREEGKKIRSKSRKTKMLELYKKCKKESEELYNILENQEDSDLRNDKLFLYFTQFGKCMYSGQTIEIEELYEENLYDIDHIYPQSIVKDDSINNRVLVKKELNAKKSDNLIPIDWQNKMKPFWKNLLDKELIEQTKYERLIRSIEFSDDEKSGFIARQLVETRQSTKALASILKSLFTESEIVYVKAGNVSDFRNGVAVYPKNQESEEEYNAKIKENEFIKVREINDFHHAKDAYLNIVVGNVYNTKFTRDPRIFFKEKGSSYRTYNLNRMYEYKVERKGYSAWIPGENGTITTVKKMMESNKVLVTRFSYEKKGQLFDITPIKKGKKDLRPLKSSDFRLQNTEKYGGYNSVKIAYFILVEHENKKNIIRTIEAIPVYLDKNNIMDYCVNNLELKNPKILLDKIKIKTLLYFDGFLACLSGKGGDSTILVQNAIQLNLDKTTEKYLKKIVKYNEKCNSSKYKTDINEDEYVNEKEKNTKKYLPITDWDKITVDENIKTYDILIDKLENTVYKKGINVKIPTDFRNKFIIFSVEEQCKILFEILKLFQCNSQRSNFTLITGSKEVGKLSESKNVTGKNIKIIHQSVTGLFENTIDLSKL